MEKPGSLISKRTGCTPTRGGDRRAGRRKPVLWATASATVLLALLAEPVVRSHLRSAESKGGKAAAVSVAVDADSELVTWDIPIHRTPTVERWIRIYTGPGRAYFEDWLHQMSIYEEFIRARLRSRGMPEDLVYVALIESGFEPLALSPARATGMWQFMEGTAREQGLRVDEYVDERLDPIRSTEAAVDFLDQLHDRFGSWYLAAAAYNAGPNRVHRVLEEHTAGAVGDEELFWEISEHLPSETRQHVPRLIAAAILGKNPDRFGFHPETRSGASFEMIFAPGGTSLRAVATAAGLSTGEIRALNPHLIRDVTPPGYFYPVRIPQGKVSRVLAGLSSPSRPGHIMAVADE